MALGVGHQVHVGRVQAVDELVFRLVRDERDVRQAVLQNVFLETRLDRALAHEGEGHVVAALERSDHLDQVLQVVVQPDVAGVHDDEFSCQAVALLEGPHARMVLGQGHERLVVGPVVDHGGLRHVPPAEALRQRLLQVAPRHDDERRPPRILFSPLLAQWPRSLPSFSNMG